MKARPIQISDATQIIRNALLVHGNEISVDAAITAMNLISEELKQIAFQTTTLDMALNKYQVSAHGEVFIKE